MSHHTPNCCICATLSLPREPSSGRARSQTIPHRDLPLLLVWVSRSKEARTPEKKIQEGMEEIFQQYRICGERGGAEYLRVWTQMLRDQNLTPSVQP
jgi:hypothetical protein